MELNLEIVTAICLGLTLSAASGFRIFLPALILSVAGINGHLQLSSEFAWVATYPALIIFSIATLIEIASYYIPLVDNLLDTIALPLALIVGTLLTADVLPELESVNRWIISIVLGGGIAETIEVLTILFRLASTGMTAGMGNPVLATVEILIAISLSLLGLFVPLLAIFLVIFLLQLAIRRIYRFVKNRQRRRRLSVNSMQDKDE